MGCELVLLCPLKQWLNEDRIQLIEGLFSIEERQNLIPGVFLGAGLPAQGASSQALEVLCRLVGNRWPAPGLCCSLCLRLRCHSPLLLQ